MRPAKDITKILLSTTSRLVGHYEDPGLFITLASQGGIGQREWLEILANPFSRNFYVLSIKTPEWKEDTIVIPNYAYLGEIFCIYMSILFGKRFDSHGLLEQHGGFNVPWVTNVPPSCNPKFPYNDHSPRIDFNIPLNLGELKRISPLFYSEELEDVREVFLTAGRFYLQGIKEFENQPEVAFLSLITCGEILSNSFDYSPEDLLDEQLKQDIQCIQKNLKNGDKISRRIKSRLYQVKAKYTRVIIELLDEQFFSCTQAPNEITSLKKDEIEKRINAAYDLRSRYVHSGQNFRRWLSAIGERQEVPVGQPSINDKELKKVLARCPTFVGLERIMRYCLLQFIQSKGVNIRNSTSETA